MVKLISTVVFPLVLMTVAGCGAQEDEEHVKLYKCERSAMYLNQNEDLVRKAVDWKAKTLPQPQSRDELMQRVNQREKAMFEVMTDNANLKKNVLLEWYNSDYCKNVVGDYQDFSLGESNRREAEIIGKNKEIEDALARQVVFYSKSLVDKESNEVSCLKLKEQIDIVYNNASAIKYRSELAGGLRATIIESVFKLKKFQQDFVGVQVGNDYLEEFSKELYDICDNDALLSNRIGFAGRVRNSKSPRSILIMDKLQVLQNDVACGELSEVYCLANLLKQAARSALEVSENCDSMNNVGVQCIKGAEEIYEEEFKKIELGELLRQKQKYEQYIADPSGTRSFNSQNAQGNIYILAEKCKKEGLERGLKGLEYQKYANEVCEENAKQEFLMPQISTLKRINSRIEQLRS